MSKKYEIFLCVSQKRVVIKRSINKKYEKNKKQFNKLI